MNSDETIKILLNAFETIIKAFSTNIWVGVGSTVCFGLGIIGFLILNKKYEWFKRVKDGQDSVNDSIQEGTQAEQNVSSGDDWNPSP